MKRKQPTAKQVRAWLKAHGHDAGMVDALKLSSKADKLASLTDLHRKEKKHDKNPRATD